MTNEFKIKLSNFCNSVIVFTIALTGIWFIGFFIVQAFDLTVFKQKTSESLFLFLFVVIVIVACCAILSVSLNISIIAQSKINESGEKENAKFGRKAILYIASTILALAVFLFVSNFYSKSRKKSIILEQSNEIVTKNKTVINNIFEGLRDTSKTRTIYNNIKILSSKNEDLPDVKVLLQRKFQGEMVFLELTEYDFDVVNFKKNNYSNLLYTTKKEDKKYLEDVFLKDLKESLFFTKETDYYVYTPMKKNRETIILVFSKDSFGRYGKIGSR